MKVLHLMLSCFYIDNANYQENVIPRINKKDGHEVLIIASTDVFTDVATIGSTNPGEYINEDGIKVIRLPYKFDLHRKLAMKIRSYKGLDEKIKDFQPDVILFHGTAALDLNVVGNYVKTNPQVKLFVDAHEDYNNSAQNFISRKILYDNFYKKVLKKNLPYIQKILYITKETKNFLKEVFKIPEDKLSFFPLGGTIPSKDEQKLNREQIRKELVIKDDEILCIHSGKMDKLKRTEEILKGFIASENTKLRLVIIGSVGKDFEEIFNTYLSNPRIQFLGWKKASELQKYLMASDLYIQLGSQSATLQNAICCGSVAASFPHESYVHLLDDAFFSIKDEQELTSLLDKLTLESEEYHYKKNKSNHIAENVLDYQKISNSFL